jgi:hypothetical protein
MLFMAVLPYRIMPPGFCGGVRLGSGWFAGLARVVTLLLLYGES